MMGDVQPRGLIELRRVECDPNPNLIQIRPVKGRILKLQSYSAYAAVFLIDEEESEDNEELHALDKKVT